MRLFFKKIELWSKQQYAQFRLSNSGEWKWLVEKPVTIASLNRSLWRGANPSLNYYALLFFSAVISVLGLLADSAATIIGAMIVAPLMGPIIGIAFAMVVNNRRLLKRSTLALSTGMVLTVGTAVVICQLVGIGTLNSEVVARVRPNLMDLGVALAAGAAGAFAKSRRGIADALPGVAIAVALVPPLSVIGIGIALGSRSVTMGSSLLFVTNLTGIVLSGGLVFIWQRYSSLDKAQKGLTLTLAALLLIVVPLGFSFSNLVLREQARRSVNTLIRRRTLTFSASDIRLLEVQREGNILVVNLEVAAPLGSISAQQVDLVQNFLERELNEPITLKVRIFPVNEFEASASTVEENNVKESDSTVKPQSYRVDK